jgi:hypothetical protein
MEVAYDLTALGQHDLAGAAAPARWMNCKGKTPARTAGPMLGGTSIGSSHATPRRPDRAEN